MPDTNYDTNFGWWTDKPEREDRTVFEPPISLRPHRPVKSRIWRNLAWIVVLATAVIWGVKLAVAP